MKRNDPHLKRRFDKPSGIIINIPGKKRPLKIDAVIFDFNGTLAVDGNLIRGVASGLKKLARLMDVFVVTADTFGSARRVLAGLPVKVHVIRRGADKRKLVESIGRSRVAAIGNGVNDVPMLQSAALGIAVIGDEGASIELLRTATIVVGDINKALDLLLKPKHLIATLRK